jgi:hypothetical protein
MGKKAAVLRIGFSSADTHLHCCFILPFYPMSSNLLDCHKHKNFEMQVINYSISYEMGFKIFDNSTLNVCY